MRMVLTRLDYIVYCVGSASEAAVALSHNQFSLALIASRLKDGSGLSLSKKLRDRAQKPLPIILFGHSWDAAAMDRECENAGIQGFLHKPISISRLVDHVRHWTRAANDSQALLPDNPPVLQRYRDNAGHSPVSALAAARQHRTAPRATLGLAEPGTNFQPNGEAMAAIDLDHLGSFTEGDAQLESELVSLYISTAQQYLAQMQECQAKDEAWDGVAHALKGSSNNIGAKQVAALALQAEKSAPDAELLQELNARLTDVIAFHDARSAAHDQARAQARQTGANAQQRTG